jgi:hypothetical protein
MKDITDTSAIQLDEIAIYAVHESDGTLAGFSFDAQPGTAEQDRVHTPIDRSNPEGKLNYYPAIPLRPFRHGLPRRPQQSVLMSVGLGTRRHHRA